jgi:hypothetical protein
MARFRRAGTVPKRSIVSRRSPLEQDISEGVIKPDAIL